MNSAVEPQAAANPKLPLWDTICFSYEAYFSNFGDLLRISWLWLLVVAETAGMANWIKFSLFAEAVARIKPPIPPLIQVQLPLRLGTLALEIVAFLVVAFAFASIAVAWHRRIILGEHPKFSGSNLATKALWRYVGVGLVIALAFIGSWLAISLLLLRLLRLLFVAVGGLQSPSTLIVFLLPLQLLIYLLFMLAMLRLILLLPARAVGDLGLTFRETWTRTRRNTWRMFWGVAACVVVPAVPAEMIWLFIPAPSDISLLGSEAFAVRLAVVTTISIVYALLTVPIMFGFLSLSYRHFFQRT